MCDEVMQKYLKSQEEQSITKTAHDEIKVCLEKTLNDLNGKSKELDILMTEVARLKEERQNVDTKS